MAEWPLMSNWLPVTRKALIPRPTRAVPESELHFLQSYLAVISLFVRSSSGSTWSGSIRTDAIGLSPCHSVWALDSQVSTGRRKRVVVSSVYRTSTVAGSTSCPLFTNVTLSSSILVTARSKRQLCMYQPRQNQSRSSPPSLAISRKKSEGEGCLNAQSRMYLRKAQSKRDLPKICSRSNTIPYAPLK